MKAVAAVKGKISITEIDLGIIPEGHVRIRTEYSAISPGTEMTFIKRASEQPGLLGYSAVGVIEQIGSQVTGLEAGQRVACYGAPYVRHAEWLTVPSNLTAPVPDHVRPEEAAFAGLGAIAIHALRVADLRFGESVVIVGLGILGQMTAQIASAAGFQVAALDVNAGRVELLRRQGIGHAFDDQEQLEGKLAQLTGGHGADCVILCAGGPGEALINRSLAWIRDKGEIVIVGDLSTEFSRGLMFGKEAEVLISRAGGPGRYDAQYELENRDYPIGYVRWTEGRNIGEYVRLLAEKRIKVEPLISNIFPLERADEAYRNYEQPGSVMGTLLKYEK
ncbi:zinc-binding alcohol dehydrogenase [Paenibacillus sp. GCM10027628]|uniref:zinc-dependent alcohol dehydrogenase n=1 Tax=Paenibacillus sp. GCM10027628 TaxID=3273413 RepID=UPI00362EE07C